MKQLGWLRPFATIPSTALEVFADTVKPVTILASDSYSLPLFVDNHYLLPLHGLLVLQKSHSCRSRPFSTLLPLGGLWPLPRITEPDMRVAVHAIADGLMGLMTDVDLQRLCQQTAVLRLALINSIGLAWQRMTEDADYRTSFPLPVQLAHILLELSQVRGQQIVVPYTHEQLAVLLNSYRETVTIMIGQFRRRGWLETRKGSIRLLDIPALTEAVQDDDLVQKLKT